MSNLAPCIDNRIIQVPNIGQLWIRPYTTLSIPIEEKTPNHVQSNLLICGDAPKLITCLTAFFKASLRPTNHITVIMSSQTSLDRMSILFSKRF